VLAIVKTIQSRSHASWRARLFPALLLCLAVMCPVGAETAFANGFESARAVARGGTNLHWFRLGEGCVREPYGIIANYHEPGVREITLDQLISMRAAGHERINTGIYHLRPDTPTVDGRVTGTILDSTGGRLHPQMQQNLIDFLADIRDAGFSEILFRYFPQWRNDVRNGMPFDNSLLDENYALIASIEPLLQAAGMAYRTDLFAEGMPRARVFTGGIIIAGEPNNSAWSNYARAIWQRYFREFGLANTVGMSFVSDVDGTRIDSRVAHLNYVYRVDGTVRLPPVFAFSFYGDSSRDEGWIFRRYQRRLRDAGLSGTGWIISESYFNDPAAANSLIAAMAATNQKVWYLTQWPLQRGPQCSTDVSVAPPVAFDAFLQRGF
jgi:hypothetical protein